MTSAAAMPSGIVTIVEITANETLSQMECPSPDENASA